MSIEDLEDLDPEAAKEKKLELLAARARVFFFFSFLFMPLCEEQGINK